MLFADVVGFTELSERHDAEVVRRLISEAFTGLAAEVSRYGGTVEKFAGDALLAVFGVPVTHEDDPERAVRAALEMQAVMATQAGAEGETLQLRIGIESGEVLADLDRSTTERDLFVTGDPVNTAARLQTAAAPGSVMVGPTTYASTRGLIEYDELPAQALKGKELPVASWRAVRVRARRGGLRTPLGIEAPLIGREAELALLKETIRKTAADGRPHLLTVVGDAGVGKTRLIWELEKYLDGLPETFYWRKGRCYSYASVSYSPLVEAIKADASISDDDPPDVIVAKLDARIAELADADELPVRAALGALMGLADAEHLARDELFEAWRLYLAAIASRHPLVLVVEDIHWADDVTLDFIEFVARWGDAPITLICVARSELLEHRQTWGGGIRNAMIAELTPLEPRESVAMIDGLLGGALPSEVSERVVAMANGNPLFTEELVRMFVDQGVLRSHDGAWQFVGPVTELSVPSSVQAVLSARLDGLSAQEKRTAQEASVIGRIFWDVIVAHLRARPTEAVVEALHGLRVKELVAPRTPSTLAGAAEWSFHHVLVRDVAYDSLPKSDRGALHLQVAHWAEQELSGRTDELAELIASHTVATLQYEEELRSASADDAPLLVLREETMRAAIRAARRAGAVGDRRSAHRWQLVAMEQAHRLDRPDLERARLALEFHDLVGDELDAAVRVAVFEEAAGLLPPGSVSRDERELRGQLLAHHGRARYETGEADVARAILHQAAEELLPDSPSPARARALQILSAIQWRELTLDQAGETARLAIAEARAAEATDVHRWAIHEAGVVKSFQGDQEGGMELLRESRALAVEAGDRDLVMRCDANIASAALNGGYQLDEPARLLLEGANMARRMASYKTLAFMLDNLGDLYSQQGRFREILEMADEMMDALARAGLGSLVDVARCAHRVRGDALAALARIDEARQELQLAADIETPARQHGEMLLISQSRLDLADDPAAAIARLSSTLESYGGYANAQLNVALWLARLAYRGGDARGLQEALDAQNHHEGTGGPARRLERAWAQALADEDGQALVAASEELEALGYLTYAVEALVDAALVAARQGDATAALDRAQRRVAVLGYRPLLGPLPEARWITPAGVSL